MVKVKAIFICDKCGNETLTWAGKCFSCGSWNTLKEMRGLKSKDRRFSRETDSIPQKLKNISLKNQERIKTGIFEFDRVVGGGIVPGSLVLLAGNPGIGKSTLLLQIAASIEKTLYVSGEESAFQIKMRAERLGIKSNFLMLDEINIENIIALVQKEKPAVLAGPLQDFCVEHPHTEIRVFPDPQTLHDRYILTKRDLYLLGQGIKDIGGRESFIIMLPEEIARETMQTVHAQFLDRWGISRKLN